MNTTPFNMIRDINGYNGYGLSFSNFKRSATIVQNTDTTMTVPSDCSQYLAIFSIQPGTSVWVALQPANGTTIVAAVPASGLFTTTTSELNPVARLVNKGDILHFITADTTADVGVTLYALQSAN